MANKKSKAPSKLPKKRKINTPLNIALMLLWVFSSVIAGQAIVGYPMYWILGADGFHQPVWSAVYSALSYVVSLVFTIFIPFALFKRWHVTWKDLGINKAPSWTDIGLAPIGFIVATILAGALMAICKLVPGFDADALQNIGFSYYLVGADRIIAFLTLVVVAPIAEEIIFRGWLYGLIRKETSSHMKEIWSMVLSSLLVSFLFGLVHFQWNVSVNVFAMSLVLCALREITGTINAGILMHMIKNGVAFWLLYVMNMY